MNNNENDNNSNGIIVILVGYSSSKSIQRNTLIEKQQKNREILDLELLLLYYLFIYECSKTSAELNFCGRLLQWEQNLPPC